MKTTPRYLESLVRTDALRNGKMAFLSGPRQVGKTTLGKALLESAENYFSWDVGSFRRAWSKDPEQAVASRGPGPVLLDELHKSRQWKRQLKGLYDVSGDQLPLIVTGSARLDLYRRGGDSLMGRYVPYRLHPFSVGERESCPAPEEVWQAEKPRLRSWQDLLRLGGFPEPFLEGSEAKAARWSRLRLERLVREDVRDLRNISDLESLRVLTDLLPERVGSPLSLNSLKGDLSVAYGTVRSWVQVLEALYHCVLIRPYAASVRRALVAEPKLYLYDILSIKNEAARQENLAALHLLKACQYWTDAGIGDFDLRYFRTKEKKEIDFLLLREKKPWALLECKSNARAPTPALIQYAKAFGTKHNVQLVQGDRYRKDFPAHNVRVQDYESFFASWC